MIEAKVKSIPAAVLGFVSGTLTTLAWILPGKIASGSASGVGTLMEHIAPGLSFGLILGVWIANVRSASMYRVAAFVLLVEASWLAAFYFARFTADHWDGVWNAVAEIGVAAGLIGGIGVTIATTLAFRLPIRAGPTTMTAIVGAAAGALLPVEFEPDFLVPLFYVWHAAVAASLGWAVGTTKLA